MAARKLEMGSGGDVVFAGWGRRVITLAEYE